MTGEISNGSAYATEVSFECMARFYGCVHRNAAHISVFPFHSICFQQQIDLKNANGEKAGNDRDSV